MSQSVSTFTFLILAAVAWRITKRQLETVVAPYIIMQLEETYEPCRRPGRHRTQGAGRRPAASSDSAAVGRSPSPPLCGWTEPACARVSLTTYTLAPAACGLQGLTTQQYFVNSLGYTGIDKEYTLLNGYHVLLSPPQAIQTPSNSC